MVCRFYGYTIAEVRELTLRQFGNLSRDMYEIDKMENGEGDQPGTGGTQPPACVPAKRQRAIARSMFGGKK